MPCPLWVKSRHVQRKTACPLYPQKRTSSAAATGDGGAGQGRASSLRLLASLFLCQPRETLVPLRYVKEDHFRIARFHAGRELAGGLSANTPISRIVHERCGRNIRHCQTSACLLLLLVRT